MVLTFTTNIGLPGSGKTYLLLENYYNSRKDYNCFICANTHSNIDVLKKMYNQIYDKELKHTSTIYKLFQIDFIKHYVGGLDVKGLKTSKNIKIYVDEFGLINIILFNRIITELNKLTNYNIEIILYGDPLQLSPVHDSENTVISYKHLEMFETYFKKQNVNNNNFIEIIKQFNLNTFFSEYIQNGLINIIKTNHRFGNYVSEVLNYIYDDGKECEIKIINELSQVNHLVQNGYVFLDSTYKGLQKLVDMKRGRFKIDNFLKTKQNKNIYKSHLKRIYLNVGDKIRINDTYKNKDNIIYFNNEELTFIDFVNDHIACLNSAGNNVQIHRSNDVFNIVPSYCLTIHKSQGMTIDKVIMSVDNLFYFNMFFTGITRAKTDIIFYSDNNLNVNSLREIAKIKTFSDARQIIYN